MVWHWRASQSLTAICACSPRDRQDRSHQAWARASSPSSLQPSDRAGASACFWGNPVFASLRRAISYYWMDRARILYQRDPWDPWSRVAPTFEPATHRQASEAIRSHSMQTSSKVSSWRWEHPTGSSAWLFCSLRMSGPTSLAHCLDQRRMPFRLLSQLLWLRTGCHLSRLLSLGSQNCWGAAQRSSCFPHAFLSL